MYTTIYQKEKESFILIVTSSNVKIISLNSVVVTEEGEFWNIKQREKHCKAELENIKDGKREIHLAGVFF